jgi:hypothetical protein
MFGGYFSGAQRAQWFACDEHSELLPHPCCRVDSCVKFRRAREISANGMEQNAMRRERYGYRANTAAPALFHI